MLNVVKNTSGATPVAQKKEVVSVVEQIRLIAFPHNRLAFIIGSLIGSFVPVAVFSLTTHVMGDHHNIVMAWGESLENKFLLVLIAAGAVFSAKSVYGWGLSAFAGDRWKAFGYCVLIEGVMVLSPITWLRFVAMAYLVLINMIATGANLMEPCRTSPEEAIELSEILRELEGKKTRKEIAAERGISVRTLGRRIKQAHSLNLVG